MLKAERCNEFNPTNQEGTPMDSNGDVRMYTVVVNHEEQYSIWPVGKKIPLGWQDAGKSGSKEECLSHIKEVWTDMRPLSLRKQMEEASSKA
jgi:MbtH protein